MKDKLRDLAEIRDHHRNIAAIAALDDKKLDVMRKHGAMADTLNAILDAEGADGAVGWISPEALAELKETRNQMHTEYVINVPNEKQSVPLYTHPARSGVVSDVQWGLIRKTLMHINAAHILGADASPKAINEWRKWLTAALPENAK